MIGLSGSVRVLIATRPVDFRKGTEGLAALVREVMSADPFDGSVYVFRAKRADRVKLVFWDGRGVCLFAKRLEEGRFQWPKIENGVMRLSAAQLSALVEGLDWKRVGAAKDTPAPRLRGFNAAPIKDVCSDVGTGSLLLKKCMSSRLTLKLSHDV